MSKSRTSSESPKKNWEISAFQKVLSLCWLSSHYTQKIQRAESIYTMLRHPSTNGQGEPGVLVMYLLLAHGSRNIARRVTLLRSV